MKNNFIISVMYSFILAGVLIYNGCTLVQEEHSSGHITTTEINEEFELADVMFKLQRHFNKLWFSGMNSNWPLASFYVHELEEALEELEDARVMEEGQNISELAKMMTHHIIEDIEHSLANKNREEFKNSYHTMINACNACHVITKHEFVVIKTPEKPAFDNQVY